MYMYMLYRYMYMLYVRAVEVHNIAAMETIDE